jgi:hypothetical protein
MEGHGVTYNPIVAIIRIFFPIRVGRESLKPVRQKAASDEKSNPDAAKTIQTFGGLLK